MSGRHCDGCYSHDDDDHKCPGLPDEAEALRDILAEEMRLHYRTVAERDTLREELGAVMPRLVSSRLDECAMHPEPVAGCIHCLVTRLHRAEAQLAAAQARIAELEETLKFYADPCSWMVWSNHPEYQSELVKDRGQRAKKALDALDARLDRVDRD